MQELPTKWLMRGNFRLVIKPLLAYTMGIAEMKLLFVHERFGSMAGAEVNAFLTAQELKRRGHAVGILHGLRTGRGEAEWRETFEPAFELRDPGQVSEAVRAFCPDAIYVHKMADLEVLKELVKSGFPLVRMVHDHDIYCMRSYKYNPFTRNICKRQASLYCVFPCGATLARNRDGGLPVKWVSFGAKLKELRLNRKFDRMIVATEYMRDELLRNGFDEGKIEIHAPVPKTEGEFAQSSFSDRNLIIYAGQIIRGKGVDVLLESLAQVKSPFECIILGEGSHRAHCEALSKSLGLEKRVTFKGYVPHDELRAFYSEASMTVMSSVWPEPFGASGLEGMRHGLPVVAFDAGGIKEWLIDRQNGFLVSWMNRGEFAARVDQLLQDKNEARRLGQNGRQFVQNKFNFGNYVDKLEKMFLNVVNKKRDDHEKQKEAVAGGNYRG